MKFNYLAFVLSNLIAFSSVTAQEKVAPMQLRDNYWYKNSLIYNLEIGVFKDSDGDGRGDINGVIEKLDYLKALGVDVIWLAPFQPSPGEDDGYDVADYYGIDPKFGTGGDFAELMHQANKRGMRIIMDLVINHTSDQHPWFKDSRKSKDSRYRDWYVWSKQRPKDWNKGMVFPGVQKGVWTLDEKSGEYYYHRFYKFQPDLNYLNPEVMQESQRIIGYWLNMGVSGFRLDAVPFIIEVPGTGSEKPKLDFNFLTSMRQFADSRKNDIAILGEANVEPKENQDYFGAKGEGIHMMFNFYANQHLFYALATGDTKPFRAAIDQTNKKPESAQWANFLRNHDEIDLGRLTEKQRNQVYAKFGPDTSMQLYDRGIRRRLAPMLSNNRKHIELAYSLLFAMPGAPVLRYGEEIGMGDDLSLKERMSVRTPMQWNGEMHAGFTTADSSFRSVIKEGEYGYPKVNVSDQYRDPNSLLSWMGKLIKLRKSCPEIGLGDYAIVDVKSPHVVAIQYTYKGKSLLVLHNFSDQPVKAAVKTGKSKVVYDLMVETDDKVPTNGELVVELAGYGYKWYRSDSLVP
jgi:maltose alpha-D-glucosyltransferase/alpha-amylase